jgi:putative addiction module component (TIGR02574 family)
MQATEPDVFDDALALPLEQRARLVDILLSSLNPSTSAEIYRQWKDEAERRVAEIESGEARLVDGEDAFRRLRAKHGR